MKKILTPIIIALIILSCADKKSTSDNPLGKKVYKQNCVVCHGIDGKLGANGSKDLTMSKMSLEERKAIVKNGKGAMVGLGGLLKPEQIHAVAEYSMNFK